MHNNHERGLVASGPLTVLLVEDETALLSLFELAFRNQGFSVLSARSGEEALQRLNEYSGPLDVLVSDVHMPGIRGHQLGLKLVETRPDLKVILMSGYADQDLELQQGWVFLPKPVLPRTIIGKIREITGPEPQSHSL